MKSFGYRRGQRSHLADYFVRLFFGVVDFNLRLVSYWSGVLGLFCFHLVLALFQNHPCTMLRSKSLTNEDSLTDNHQG